MIRMKLVSHHLPLTLVALGTAIPVILTTAITSVTVTVITALAAVTSLFSTIVAELMDGHQDISSHGC